MNRMKGAAWAAVGVVVLSAAVLWRVSGDATISGQSHTGVSTPVVAAPAAPKVVSTPLPPQQRGRMSVVAPASPASSGRAAAASASSGELFAYSKTDTPHREGPYTYYPVDIDVDQVLASALSGRLTFTAPDGSQIALDYDRHVSHDDGNWTWMGRETGGTASQDAVITFGPDATYGSLPSSNGQQLRITTIQGKTYVTSASYSQLQPGVREGGDTIVKAADASATTPVPATSQPVVAAASAVTGTPVDVVVGYSTTYRTYLGSVSAVTTRLTNLIDVANRGLGNSAITTASFRLVGTVEVNYADNSDNGVALSDLASTSTSSPLAAMRAARAQYGADLVAFMRRYTTGQNGCGLAYIPQAPYSSSGRDQTFAVVGDGSIDLGGGAYSYCPDTSLAHEMGHNLGAQHNSQTNSTGGLHAYSYGYRNDDADFYDIMSYGLNGQEAELLYSTPAVSTCKNLPCGVAATADIARTFRETMLAAASFRSTVVPMDQTPPGQIVGPGGRCLDAIAGSTANGTGVQVWACNGLRQQQWGEVASLAALQNKDTPLVLDAVGYGTSSGTPLQLYEGAGTTNQSWIFTNVAIVVAGGGRILDGLGGGLGNGTPIQLYDDLGTSNQRWNFDPRTNRITNPAGRCLDVQGFGTANGTPVQIWDCNGTANQEFHLASGGTLVGYGGNCLEAANAGQGNGTQVRMWACNGGAHQKWRFRGEIRGAQSGLCVDDPAGGQANGSRVQLYQCLGNDHQRWEYQPN
ncbi:MAG: RICIN domain-containing protein [Luteibacter sp.]|uniref:RICIN domain-containing protein n=1 Tax=Luteibacter sp. TaxID=1886636 RepID=UPI0028085FBE|nr:RICIN domain-containing protein [Luteibacter sp.]MDQ7996402.1 ricin-type beta-trefoil lectin domain protein [Luteibacter sp.]MDQ8047970.1 ricin-type beta-trefoil lectin domain protein [Luteibacter sp.]